MSSEVLVVTPVMREPNGRARLYAKAFGSIMNIRWTNQLDYFMPNGGDDYTMGTVSRKYQEAREVFLAGKWEYMLCCEYDHVIPVDALEKLIAMESDIAYSLYAFRHSNHQWSAMQYVDNHLYVSLSDQPELARQLWGKTIDVEGVGQGCTLIKRHVLETLSFWIWPGTSCDWPLALDAKRLGMTQRCDLSLLVGHIAILPQPMILWPDINADNLVRSEQM